MYLCAALCRKCPDKEFLHPVFHCIVTAYVNLETKASKCVCSLNLQKENAKQKNSSLNTFYSVPNMFKISDKKNTTLLV